MIKLLIGGSPCTYWSIAQKNGRETEASGMGWELFKNYLIAKEKFRILRNKSQVWDGKVQTLRHFKDEVKEVAGQQECGVCFAGYESFQVGDVIECYLLEELPRSL